MEILKQKLNEPDTSHFEGTGPIFVYPIMEMLRILRLLELCPARIIYHITNQVSEHH